MTSATGAVGATPVVVASTQTTPLQHRFPVAAAGSHRATAPGGACHGLLLGTRRTLCGLPAGCLTVFPGIDFRTVGFLDRCPDCVEAIADHTGAPG